MSERAYNWCTGVAIIILGIAAMVFAPGCAATSDGLDALFTGQSSAQRSQQRNTIETSKEILAAIKANGTAQEKKWAEEHEAQVVAAANAVSEGGLGGLAAEVMIGSGVTGLSAIGIALRAWLKSREQTKATRQTVTGLQTALEALPTEHSDSVKAALDKAQDISTKMIVGNIKAGL